jgi:hypothetical protein
VNLVDLKESGMVPEDYWTHPRHYQPDSLGSFHAILPLVEGRRKSAIMYRAVPKDVKESHFRNGDWITPSRDYAIGEGQSIPGGYRIIAQYVSAGKIWWDGNSIDEFGFDDGQSLVYKNTKNNRKLSDAVVRDKSGEIVPPSKRFNSRRHEPWFSVDDEAESESFRELAGLEKSMRRVRGSNQARAVRGGIVGKSLTNIETGIVATVSGESFDKMMSKSNVERSISSQAHMQALGNIDTLFRLATLEKTRPGKKEHDAEHINAIRHFVVPMPFDGNVLQVRILAKEFKQTAQGNRLYLVEAVEIEGEATPASLREGTAVEGGGVSEGNRTPPRPAGVSDRFAQMVAAVKRGSVSQNDNLLFSIADDSGRAYTPGQRQMFRRIGRDTTAPTIPERLHGLKEWASQGLRQGLFDQFDPIRALSGHAYQLARLSKGASGAFEALLHHGKLSLRDGVYDADRSGGAIETVFQPIGKETSDFLTWVAGNRAERLMKEGKENLFTKDDIIAAQALDQGDTDFDYLLPNGQTTRKRSDIFKDTLRKFNAVHKNVLDMAEQSGLIDGDDRKAWEHEFYVPFYRVMEEGDGAFRGMSLGKGLARQKAFEKLKGGKEQLNDLLTNTLANWAHLIDASAKNRAALATLKAAERLGAARKAKYTDKANVWAMEAGKKAEYVIDDPYLLAALNAMDFSGLRGPVMDALSTTKHWLTIGVTGSMASTLAVMGPTPGISTRYTGPGSISMSVTLLGLCRS